MPQMGVSVSEGTVTKWLKSPGDTVEADEALLEISTDKVDTEVPPPASGVLSEILVQDGEPAGGGGRVTKRDIEAFLASGAARKASEAVQTPPEQPLPAPAERAAAPPPVAPEGEHIEPLNAMRRGIAEHMRRSLDTAAHVTSAI